MFLQDYKDSSLSYDDAQFVIALALDGLGEDKAARAVLFFMSPQAKNNTGNSPYKTRAELVQGMEDISREQKKDIITTALDYYFSYPVFQSGKAASRNYGGSSWCTLSSLLKTAVKSQVYSSTMHLVLHNSRNGFITLYTKTKMFKTQFSKVLNRESFSSSDFGYGKGVPASLVEELSAKFTLYVDHNCANGTYVPATCNPDGYLFKRKSAESVAERGPLGWFQLENDGEYFRILNRHGLNINVGGSEDLTLMDSVSVDVSPPDHPVRFIGLCSKICKASCLLFSHSNAPAAYYDIFSYHRDLLLKKTKNEFKKIKTRGCYIEFIDGKHAIENLSQTIANKFNCRSKICDIFEEVLLYGIRADKINNLYDRIIHKMEEECSGSTGTKDAKSPFSIFDYTSREPGTNGSRFQVLLSGYLALKEIIDFLNSDSNTLGITINQFPVAIFRDNNLLKRFSGFEEYIYYIDDVMPVYTEVAGSPQRSKELIRYFYSNDYVFDFLSRQQVIRHDVNLDLFSQTPVALINAAIARYDDAGLEKEMAAVLGRAYNKLYKSFSDAGRLSPVIAKIGIQNLLDTNNLLNKKYADYNVLSHELAKYICSFAGKPLDRLRENVANWIAVCVFSSLLRAASQMPGDHPVYDGSGRYLLERQGLLGAAWLPEYYVKNEKDARIMQQVLLKRTYALRIAMWFLWGEQSDFIQIKTNDISTWDVPWEDYWSFWKVTVMMGRYFLKNYGILERMRSNLTDTCLLSIRATAVMDFISLPQDIVSVEMLGSVVSDKDPSLFVRRDGVENYAAVCNKRSGYIVKAFNSLFSNFEDQSRFYEILKKKVDIAFGQLNGTCVSSSSGLDRILASKVPYLNSRYLTGEVNMKVAQQLTFLAEFDELGYVMAGNNTRYVYKGKKYVHKTGFVVEVDTVTRQGFVCNLTDDILLNLKARLSAC